MTESELTLPGVTTYGQRIYWGYQRDHSAFGDRIAQQMSDSGPQSDLFYQAESSGHSNLGAIADLIEIIEFLTGFDIFGSRNGIDQLEENSVFDGNDIDFEIVNADGDVVFVDWDSVPGSTSLWWDTNGNNIPDAHVIIRDYGTWGTSRTYLDPELDGTGNIPIF